MLMNVQQFSQDWLEAKNGEDAARTRRIEIEGAIVADLGKSEGGLKTHGLGTPSKLIETFLQED